MKHLLWLLLIASAPLYAQSEPPCLPKLQWPLAVSYGAIPTGVSTRYDSYAVWVCQLPGGYLTYSALFSMANVAPFAWQYATGTWTLVQASTDCATTCVAPTATEATFMQSVTTPAYPNALVAFNGASTTRNVYTTNADGTLNPTPVAGSTVNVATRCDEGVRIATAPSYYSVAGAPNASANSQTLPKGSYAVCVVSLPIGAN